MLSLLWGEFLTGTEVICRVAPVTWVIPTGNGHAAQAVDVLIGAVAAFADFAHKRAFCYG
jgi:hypothetical protein